MRLEPSIANKQKGVSLIGFIFVIVVLGVFVVLAMRVVPSVIEFSAIKKALAAAKAGGNTPREIQEAFEKQRVTGYIDSVKAQDLDIVKTEEGYEVSIAYQKKIELVGPASLLIDYAASTNKQAEKKAE
ncbi:MAG TPA: DUF4845 domain-containing protein [Noviherbaspirillum sp.]|nr:DUF4845 domain-containing protein [Noviherbaspirillum sp.]